MAVRGKYCDLMERERWKAQGESCWRGTIQGKGTESRAPTEGSDSDLGVEEDQEAEEGYTEGGKEEFEVAQTTEKIQP